MTNDIEDAVQQRMYEAVSLGNAPEALRLLRQYPGLRDLSVTLPTWLHEAADYGHIDVVKMLVDEGFDVNAGGHQDSDGPLSWALREGHFDVAKFLLERGASPTVGRLLIGAINAKQNAFELVQLLVEYGAVVNQYWRLGDDEDSPLFNALSWAVDSGREEIADYLIANGAVMPPIRSVKLSTSNEGVIDYFARQFGSIAPETLFEIVPISDCPVAIHRVRPTTDRNSVILFTTGMSDRPMEVPPGNEEFRYAELMIELPADWPVDRQALESADNRWPIDWLRKIAAYIRQEQTWLGGPIAIMNNGDPPEKFSSKFEYSSMLMAANYGGIGPIFLADGRTVHVYTLFPLYNDERILEQEQGLEELFRRFDQFEIRRLVSRKRVNVASWMEGIREEQ